MELKLNLRKWFTKIIQKIFSKSSTPLKSSPAKKDYYPSSGSNPSRKKMDQLTTRQGYIKKNGYVSR